MFDVFKKTIARTRVKKLDTLLRKIKFPIYIKVIFFSLPSQEKRRAGSVV
jgi:hypothetical protein